MILSLGSWHLLVLLALAPLLEEAAFRAGLQEWLLRNGRSRTVSILFTGIVLALLHMAARGRWEAAWILLPAVAIGIVYAHRRQLRWCVLLHAGMNGGWLWWWHATMGKG